MAYILIVNASIISQSGGTCTIDGELLWFAELRWRCLPAVQVDGPAWQTSSRRMLMLTVDKTYLVLQCRLHRPVAWLSLRCPG